MIVLKDFINLFNGHWCDFELSGFISFFKPGSTSIQLRMSFLKSVFKMFFRMFVPISNFKIFNSIIKMVSIYMMNYFRRLKFPFKINFNNLSIIFSFPIGMMIGRTCNICHVAFLGTKNFFSFLMTFIVGKFDSTIITLKNSLSRFVVTFSIAKPSFLAGRSFERGIALFANVKHLIDYNIQCIDMSA